MWYGIFVVWFVHFAMWFRLCFIDFTSGTKLQYPGFTRYQEQVKPVLRGAPVPASALSKIKKLTNETS